MREKIRRRSRKEILESTISELDIKIQKEEETLGKLKTQRAESQKELADLKIAEQKAAEEKAYKDLLATMKKQGITANEVLAMITKDKSPAEAVEEGTVDKKEA